MRIYLKKPLEHLPGPTETQYITYLHTSSGLLRLDQNQKIYKMLVTNPSPNIKTMVGAWPVTVDKTEYTLGEEIYQVPPKARVEQLRREIYRLRPESLVEYVQDFNDLMPVYYLYIPAEIKDIHPPEIKADLLYFLAYKL
jgi:hypothetical protein